MNHLREYIRNLLVEQEEEQTELEKIQDIFITNGAYAVELGKMMLPDAPEVKAMEDVVYQVRELLERFEDPADHASFADRRHATGAFWHDIKRSLETAIPNTFEFANPGYPKPTGKSGVALYVYELGSWYVSLDMLTRPVFQARLTTEVLEPVAEWAGAPVPKLSEDLLKSVPK